MEKEQLLQQLATRVKSGEISAAEIRDRLAIGVVAQPVAPEAVKKTSRFSITKLLYIVGAGIVVIGIVIFVGQIWEDIGALGRIIVTLGLGLLLAGAGSTLLKQQPENAIGATFHAMGGLLIPGGAITTLFELSSGSDSLWPVALTFGIIFLFYLALTAAQKHAILTFFAIANGTAFLYLLIAAILENSSIYSGDVLAYLTMVVGMSYLLLGHSFQGTWNKGLLGILYFFGSSALLGAAFSKVFDSGFWQLLFFAFVFGSLYLSVHFRSSSILVISTLFLIVHVSFITGEYFANSLGWPISLVLLGFVFIGLGYGSIKINKQYIQHATE